MAIFKTDDGNYVISSNNNWLEGCYDSERTARFAFRLSDEDRAKLQIEANKSNNGVITFEAIKAIAKKGE